MTMSDRSRTPNMSNGQTVVGIFDGQHGAEKALNELKEIGLTPAQVSVVAKDTSETKSMVEGSAMGGAETTGAGTGALMGGLFGGAAGWLIGIGALAIPGIGPIVAAGALATTLGGAAVGAVAGGLIGALVGAGVPEDDARTYETHVKEGRILITAHAQTADQAQDTRDVFDRYGSEVRAYDRADTVNPTTRR
jgi:uncharacterized membrane protein